jgi:hypothetical protein
LPQLCCVLQDRAVEGDVLRPWFSLGGRPLRKRFRIAQRRLACEALLLLQEKEFVREVVVEVADRLVHDDGESNLVLILLWFAGRGRGHDLLHHCPEALGCSRPRDASYSLPEPRSCCPKSCRP